MSARLLPAQVTVRSFLTASVVLAAAPVLLVVPADARGQSAPLPVGAVAAERDTPEKYLDAARLAWDFIADHTNPRTGLVAATPGYPNATTWDIASAMGAIHSANRLGIIDRDEYRERMTRLLETLVSLPLYDSAAYHKIYAVANGRMVDGGGRVDSRGYAWSATDLGRFLVWLAIIRENDPELAPLTRRIAARMDYSRIVRDGYLYGEDGNRRYPSFQEGRVGYEQYIARGFELWGHDVAPALDPHMHGRPVEVMGHELLEDERGYDRIVSEPFVMLGLELGWDSVMAPLARNVLAVQRARWEETGQVTIASEDAIDVPPNYFYYYCVYCNGEAFVIDTHTPGQTVSGPRWVSTKNAFGWHALLPGEYTELAFETVQAARGRDGWSSGVFERSGRSTGTRDINTAALILESALYVKLGRPLMESGPPIDPLPVENPLLELFPPTLPTVKP